MKKVLHFQMVTAAGAGVYAANVISEDGVAKNLAAFIAPRDMAISRLIISGALATQVNIFRNAHQGDDLEIAAVGDITADVRHEVDFSEIFNGSGVALNATESMNMTITVTGNSTISVLMELDDKMGRVNARALALAGVNAAVANTLVETGGNFPTGLNPAATYRMRAIYATSTTIQGLMLVMQGKGSLILEGLAPILSGVPYVKLTNEQATIIQGNGADILASFQAFILALAADAANVQLFWVIWETN